MDYKSLGLKCGIEIHQQLKGRKLFSNIDSKLNSKNPDRKIKRNLRKSSNEYGKEDAAAQYQSKKIRLFL